MTIAAAWTELLLKMNTTENISHKFLRNVTVSYSNAAGATTSTGLGDQPADNMPWEQQPDNKQSTIETTTLQQKRCDSNNN